MSVGRRHALVLALALLVTSVGLFEAALGDNWDLFVVLAVAVGLQLALFTGWWAGRRSVDLRADLAAWLDEQAMATGEPAERLLDRSVAAYRAGLAARE